mmetsp:Transcript_8963/g.27416  ORF Transcript_8963/g.27416 Transcript_8963/m.27416 type:complete len:274 (+) Transcript_8963:238-1059(+)
MHSKSAAYGLPAQVTAPQATIKSRMLAQRGSEFGGAPRPLARDWMRYTPCEGSRRSATVATAGVLTTPRGMSSAWPLPTWSARTPSCIAHATDRLSATGAANGCGCTAARVAAVAGLGSSAGEGFASPAGAAPHVGAPAPGAKPLALARRPPTPWSSTADGTGALGDSASTGGCLARTAASAAAAATSSPATIVPNVPTAGSTGATSSTPGWLALASSLPGAMRVLEVSTAAGAPVDQRCSNGSTGIWPHSSLSRSSILPSRDWIDSTGAMAK